jgi:antitoxin component YwqK of YwqJK toxin-antitoxin module
MINRILINTLILSLIITSCINSKKEFKIEYYKNGNVKLKCEIKNDEKHGDCFEYYEEGMLLKKSTWINNKLQENVIYYFKNGNVKSIYNYKNDTLYGGYIKFYKQNGLIKETGHYKNNIKIGYINEYYNGKLVQSRQRILVDSQKFVNQHINYDNFGNIAKEISNYYSINLEPGDSINVNQECEIEIKLEAPYSSFNDGGMDVMIGNFSEDFRLLDTLERTIIESPNLIAHHRARYQIPGKKIIRGMIVNYNQNYLEIPDKNEYLERRMYFELAIYVYENK